MLVIEGLRRLLLKDKALGLVKGIKISKNLLVTHLMLVDDIMILRSSSISEWDEISVIVQNFYVVSGLSINKRKARIILNEASKMH